MEGSLGASGNGAEEEEASVPEDDGGVWYEAAAARPLFSATHTLIKGESISERAHSCAKTNGTHGTEGCLICGGSMYGSTTYVEYIAGSYVLSLA